uniref:hypothetical protein n=1 Tax=Ningiella ruwaisensis TaxID=2364274 RepID=UPI00109F8FCC|nr:hypothetical protein [Ningiella ruwaisensis]
MNHFYEQDEMQEDMKHIERYGDSCFRKLNRTSSRLRHHSDDRRFSNTHKKREQEGKLKS